MTENGQKDNQRQQQHQGSGASGEHGTGTARQQEHKQDESTADGAYKNETGDPGRTPGSAEGVEDFEKTGNE